MQLKQFLVTYHRQVVSVLLPIGALAGMLAAAMWAPGPIKRIARPFERLLARLSHRPILVVFLSSFLVALLVNLIAGGPIPRIHDEFSYLLAGDTFAHGRLTNPPHEFWRHFETMHVLMQPTYASKFQPAQGLSLGVGQALFGAPWIGVVLTTALGCAALAWALGGWLRPRWALLGGLIASVHPQIVIWSHMYWGGTVAMIGGSLVLGAIPRILRRQQVPRNSALLALGGAILVASRPYEALVWGLIAAATLLIWLVRQKPWEIPRLVARIALPSLAVILPVMAMLAYYNWRVTGNPREMPYTLHTRQYMAVPLLFWQEIPPPREYLHHALYHQHRVFEWNYFFGQRSVGGWVRGVGFKLYTFAEFHLLRNLPLLLGLLALPWALGRNRWMWLACAYAGAFFVAYGIIPWFEHHYVGAVMGLFFLLTMRGWQAARTWRPRGRRVGQALAWLCVASCLPVLLAVFAREYRSNRGHWWYERYKVEQRLTGLPGKHLVFVHYDDAIHESGYEWVYNSADIDGSRIVWARQINPQEDRKLMEYFSDRRVWVVNADEKPPSTHEVDRSLR